MGDRLEEKAAHNVDGYMLVEETGTLEVATETSVDGNVKFSYSPRGIDEDVEEDDIIYVDEVELQEEADINEDVDSNVLEEQLDVKKLHEESNESEFYLLHENDSDDQLLIEMPNKEITLEEDNEYEEKITHTLHLRRNSRDCVDYYYCGQCQVDYDSIEEFSRCHAQDETNLFMQDEVIVPEFDVVYSETEQGTELKPDIIELIHNVNYNEKQSHNAKSEEKLKEALIKQETLDEDNNDKFFCYECHMVFNDFKTAEDHECSSQTIASASNDDSKSLKNKQEHCFYACIFCQAKLKTYGGLQRHQLNCRMKPPSMQAPPDEFKCETCFKILPSAKALLSHKRHHEMPEKDTNDEIKCSICSTVFRSYKNLKLHQKIHDKKPIKSIQEALPFGAALEYNESNKFYCEICNKNFDQNLLAVHKNMHQNVEEFNCGICNKQFENMSSYEMHMQLHADKTQEPRGQTKAERSGIKLPFPCQYCGREFARPHEKVKHERIHTGEKPYECEVCGKTFRVSYSLTLHLRSHTDIRPYVCATCNKRFKSQPVYAHHLNTHLAERPYKCSVCPKSFRTSVQLCGHKNSHSKPFNCTECNRPFATLYAVKIHMKTHCKSNKSSENLKHRCTVCGAVYARVFALRFHMKEQHSMELGDDIPEFELNGVEAVGTAAVTSSVDLEDEDAAILIAAATEASNNAIAAIGTKNNYSQNCYNEDEISTQAILQSDEIIVDNFHTEEIVTDW